MSHAYTIVDNSALYYLTLQVVSWADIFTRKIYRDIIIDSLQYCQVNKGLEVYAYVIMSNHVHIILRASNDNLSAVLRDFKSYTSKQILQAIQEQRESRREWLLSIFRQAASKHKRNKSFQVWTHENRAIEVYSNKFIDQR